MELKKGDKCTVIDTGYYYRLKLGEKITYIRCHSIGSHEWRLKDGNTIFMSDLSLIKKVKSIKLYKSIIK